VDLVPDRVDLQPADPVHLALGAALGPAQDGPHPGDQFSRVVRLGQVVVRAQIEPEQQVVLGGPGGQHDDRQVPVGPAAGPQHPADVQAVDLRHHHVEHQQIGAAPARLVDGGPAVVHDDRQMALPLEVAPNQLRLLPIVFRDKDPGWHRPEDDTWR